MTSHLASAVEAGGAALWLFIWIAIIGVYWVPSIIAFARKMPHKAPILLIDLLAGWTGIGWLVALVMAAWPKPRQAAPPPWQLPQPPHPQQGPSAYDRSGLPPPPKGYW